jgi:hypothetical protein
LVIHRDNFLLIPSCLLIEAPPEFEQWENMANYLLSVQRSLYWWIGDYIVYGEAHLGDDIYQAIDPSFSLRLIEQCAAVSRAFPLQDRHTSLSWSHHQCVLGLDPKIQQAALRKAEVEQWDTKAFKRYVSEFRNG